MIVILHQQKSYLMFQVNCNLEGVMVNEILDYSPAVEMLRVPLIVSTRSYFHRKVKKFVLALRKHGCG